MMEQVSKDYVSGGRVVHALRDCTLSIAQGELVGLFGPNGAGKTTLIHVLSTLIAPTSGVALVGGHDVQLEPLAARMHIGVLTETQRAFHGRLSGRQNLEFFAALHGLSRHEASRRMERLLGEFGLADAADRPVQTYSSGMAQRLHLVRVLLHDPPVLLLDEPTNSMDIQTADLVRHLVKDELVANRGKTVLYTTHDLYEMDRFCERIAIIHQGSIAAQGTVNELLAELAAPQRIRVQLAPGGDATMDALDRLPSVTSLRVVRRQPGSAEVEIALGKGSELEMAAVWNALSAHGEALLHLEQLDRDGIGRLLRHYAQSDEETT